MKPIHETCQAPKTTAQSARVDDLFTGEYVNIPGTQTFNPCKWRSTTCQIIELDSRQMRIINGVTHL
jgi:hypothetical protein